MARVVELDVPEVDWQRRLLRGRTGAPQGLSSNVALIVHHDRALQGIARYCAFSKRVMRHGAAPWRRDTGGPVEWSDNDTLQLRHWLASKYSFEPGREAAADGVMAAALEREYHPVRDYLNGLQWDGERRLNRWLYRYLGCRDGGDVRTQRYLYAVGTWWMQGAVARVMAPGCKFDYMLILEGRQGSYKSTALGVLGGDWFSDGHIDLNSKEGNQFVQGIWIAEMAELDALNKVEATRVKSFLGMREDRFRPPFGRSVVAYPRECVFAGSTNLYQYLRDPTGNRRFWPVECGVIDTAGLRQDRDQLWAEAVARYRAGRRSAPDAKWRATMDDQQDRRYSSDALQELIDHFLSSTTRTTHTMSEIMGEALDLSPKDMQPQTQVRVGLIMAKLGWRKVRQRARDGSGRLEYVYHREDRS